MIINDEVIKFILKRFPKDNNWKTGNCFYFAVILHARFPHSTILYDVIDGHFVTEIGGTKYDWEGIVSDDINHVYINWDNFDSYDERQKQAIIDGCIL